MDATNKQKQAVYALIERTGSTRGRDQLCASFSDGRTADISKLTFHEADQLIKHLTGQMAVRDNSEANKCNEMRRKIIAMAHKLNWKKPDGKIDMDSINKWCMKYSPLKKKLNEHEYAELPALVTQFEKMYFSTIKKK